MYTVSTVLKKIHSTELVKNLTILGNAYRLEGAVLLKTGTPNSRIKTNDLQIMSKNIHHYVAGLIFDDDNWIVINDLEKNEGRLDSKNIVPHILVYALK